MLMKGKGRILAKKEIIMRYKKKERSTELILSVLCALLTVAAAHVVFMLFSGKHLFASNPYNSYILQAKAWCSGTLYLPENYPWLELAVYKGHYYVSFPPFPSYLLLPFTAIFGENTPDSLIAFCVMLVGVVYAVRVAKHCGLSGEMSAFMAVFLYCANNVWMVTVDAWVWFLAQNLALTLTLMAFDYGLSGKFGRSLFFLAAAVGCRPFQIVYLPVVLYWLMQKELSSRQSFVQVFLRRIYRFIPALLLGASYMVLNVLRFNDPFEFGHNFLPEFLRYEEGQFSVEYLIRNLPRLFELPTFDPESHKLVFQGFDGTNIFIVFPILAMLLFALIAEICRRIRTRSIWDTRTYISVIMLFVLAAAHVLLLCAHRTMGGAHFGNRYLIDTLPALYLALCKLTVPDETQKMPILQKIYGMLFMFCGISGLLINFVGVLQFYAQ